MKRSFTLALLCLIAPFFAHSQGTIKESLIINSSILNKEVRYNIYLPSDYNSSERSYPVLYLLHGYTDDETGWTQFGQVGKIADQQADNVEIAPMIIAMPDGGVTFYVNSYDEKELWEDFFIQEFIPFIDKTYHTRAEKQFRAVAGLSMGGHGALIFGLKHPELFAASAPLSAGVLTEKEFIDMAQNSWDNVWGIPYGKGLVGKKRISDHMKNNWAISLVENGNTEEQKKVKYYIDCGDDDFLVRGNLALKLAMMDKGIEHEFRMRQGGHSWSYWRTALPDVLLFVSESFRR